MRWTERQLEAIKVKDKDILVSASAGSGKTAVLSERIIDLIINEKVDIDKFIVVTFTKLAANEMRQRIIKNLEKLKIDIEDKKLERFIERQIILAQKANISTLHSFGLSLIKDYFYLLNLSPNVDMIDEVEQKMIKSELINDIFNEYYASEDINFKKLNRMYGGFRTDDGLKTLVNKFASFALNMVNPYKAIDDAISIYVDKDSYKKEELYNNFKQEAVMILKDIRESLKEYVVDLNVIESDIDVLDNILNCLNTSFESLQVYLSNVKFATLRFPKDYDEIEKEEIQKTRKQMKDYIKSLSKSYFKDTMETLELMLSDMREPIKVLAEITKRYIKEYDDIKREMNKIDFNDIEHLTLKLLLDDNGNITDICKDIRDTYRYVIVDEYQDINEVQETILKGISTYKSEIPNMFMVGDIKQSIYRFRKADPEIFAGKYNNFSKDIDSNEYKIDLNQNFRSRKEVLDSINTVFEKIMKKSIGDIEYDDEMKLVYGDLYSEEINQDYKTEQHIIVEQKYTHQEEVEEEKNDGDEILEDISKYEKEAILIANKVNEYMNNKFQVYDMKSQTYRDIRYSDFTVLLRSMGNDSYALYNKLYTLGIPVTFGKEENFITRIEILQFINILKILDNPYDDIPVVSTLYSQMFKFTCEDLYEISKKREKNVTFFETLMSYKVDDELNKKINRFFEYYDKWRQIGKNEILLKLVSEVAVDIDIMLDMMYREDATIKQSGIKQFVNLVDKYEKANNCSLSDLISYLDFIIDNKVEIISETETELDDSISIMTIHKSKGLEYPVVFLPMMGKNFNLSDSREKVILDKKYGLVSSYINSDKYFMTSNFYKEVLIDKLNKENLAEEMRVLYVAMTRAKEKIIMIGTTKDNSILDEYKAKDDYLSIIKSKSYLDLVKPSIFSNKQDIKREILTDVTYEGVEVPNIELRDIEPASDLKTKPFIYEYDNVIDKKEKVSVTQLKILEKEKMKGLGKNNEVKDTLEEKNYISNTKINLVGNDKMSPTEKGTMIHKIMKMIDGSIELDEYFENFVSKKIFTKEELNQVEKEKVEKYLNSELFSRIKNSKLVKKEMPFMMRKKASEVYGDVTDSNDYVIIQGIIDCMFEEEDGIVILDYKTDKVRASTPEEKKNRIEEIKNDYKKQLDLYEEAITKLTGKKVKEKILYLFDIGETVNI